MGALIYCKVIASMHHEELHEFPRSDSLAMIKSIWNLLVFGIINVTKLSYIINLWDV